jgi:catechol 2,3-dioxygenase-like lactoylglutathione lyase family enzyme
MIAYTMVGTNDKAKALEFYGKLFEGTGIKKLFDTPPGGTMFGKSPAEPMFAITPPFDKSEASVGNGVMVAMKFTDTAEVDAIHARALAAGGTCEGEPGWRMPNVFYGAYFRDLDGNKLCACVMNMGG